jgi:hypothetical protein
MSTTANFLSAGAPTGGKKGGLGRIRLAARLLLTTFALGMMNLGFSDVAHAESVTGADLGAKATERSSLDANLSLRVDDRAAALDRVVALAEAQGGWFSELGAAQVVLRIPTEKTAAFLEALRKEGDLLDREVSTTDRGAEEEELMSRLRAREQVLARYMEVLAGATPKSVVAVEREINRVVQEIEQIQGRLRFLGDQIAYSRVSVSFRFRERRAPVADGSSSFAWLNTMNMADFLADFQGGARSTRSRWSAVAPDGFASYRRAGRFQAVSPDDVAYRVRSVRNKPKAELAFWQEALEKRMVAAGYRLISKSPVTAGAEPGGLFEFAGANGQQDQAYLVAIFVDGRKIIVAEATGEATRFAARKAAVVAAISGLQP